MRLDENFTSTTEEETVDGKIAIEFVSGRKEGFCKYLSKDGGILASMEYHNDELDGLTTQYYPSGTKMVEMRYKSGLLHGEFLAYYENGMLQVKGQYVDGKLHGKYEQFDEFGDKVSECVYEQGRLYGKNLRYFSKLQGGKVCEMSFYENGYLQGDRVTYNISGEVSSITPYVMGKAQRYTEVLA